MESRAPSRALAVICLVGAVGFVPVIVWAGLSGSVVTAIAEMLAVRWQLVTLVDLLVGLVFVALWILVLERGRPRALFWIVPLFLLGNLVTLVYLAQRAWRAPSIRDALVSRELSKPARRGGLGSNRPR